MATKNCICKCKGCEILFKPKKADRLKYCSRECFFKNKAKWEKYYLLVNKEIRLLKKIKENVYVNYSYNVLIEIASLIRIKKKNKKKYSNNIGTKNIKLCNHCHNKFIYIEKKGGRPIYCNDCREIKRNQTLKKWRRISKAKRRSIEIGLKADNIDPFVIFARDKWRCHICNCKTPKSKRGTYDDNAPELDHIITLAESGTHTFNNVACCCRLCNQKKSSKSFGQLKFF
jgi:hypothetical protein